MIDKASKLDIVLILAIILFTMIIGCNLLLAENTQKQRLSETNASNGINRLICGK